MCLMTGQKEPQIATEPIIVYKAFGRGEDGSYISPIREHNFGILNVGDTIKPEGNEIPCVCEKDVNAFIVSGGYIYAFIEKITCAEYLNYIGHKLFLDRKRNILRKSQANFIEEGGLVMAECVIPVGAYYYIDKRIGKEICASELIIKDFHKFNK